MAGAPGDAVAQEAIDRALLAQGGLVAAEVLLGALLIRRSPAAADRVGRIVEVEAYGGPEDRASHARAGRTARTAPMFGPPGHAYVYLVYGMYDCLNVVTGPDGTASAVLIRAVEPLAGVTVMRERAAQRAIERRRSGQARSRGPAAGRLPDHLLASGPGRLGGAFDIDRSMTGLDLCDPDGAITLLAGPHAAPASVIRTPRIGVGYATPPWSDLAWRLVIADSPSVSWPRVPALG